MIFMSRERAPYWRSRTSNNQFELWSAIGAISATALSAWATFGYGLVSEAVPNTVDYFANRPDHGDLKPLIPAGVTCAGAIGTIFLANHCRNNFFHNKN